VPLPEVAAQWNPATSTPRGAVLVAVGLNSRPEALDDLIGVLNRRGYHTLRIAFRMCRPWFGEPGSFCDLWIEDFTRGYERLKGLAEEEPLFHLGYSLGGLVAVAFLQRRRQASFQRMALIAPALALRASSEAVRALTPLRHLHVALPSLCPERYRARRWTPLQEYHGLLQLLHEVSPLETGSPHASIPTRIFMDPRDELVSYRGVERWLSENRLTTWRLEPARKDHRARPRSPHLLLSEESAGPTCWRALTQGILEHFDAPPAA
jgi:pimeloyl-ACP methyl ester carboxylesterase